MMSFRELMGNTGRPGDWREAMAEVRAEHGRGARRWLADQFGVSPDTAGRWLSGKQRPGGRAGTRPAREAERRVIGSVDTNRSAARALRSATRIEVPEINMITSSGTGKRKPNETYAVTGEVRGRLDRVADALERGDTESAERLFADLTLDLYFGKGSVGGRHRQSDMGVAEYGDGTTIFGQ